MARRVAHEIKNPLTPITLSAERIIRQANRAQLPPECPSTCCTGMRGHHSRRNGFGQTAGRRVLAVFPPARGAARRLRSERGGCRAASSVFEGRLEGIDVHVDLAAGLPPVMIDPEQFKRVVVNLIDNAAEAMQDSPAQDSQRADARRYCRLPSRSFFADSGCGITADEKEKLFLPYFSTKGRGTGSGPRHREPYPDGARRERPRRRQQAVRRAVHRRDSRSVRLADQTPAEVGQYAPRSIVERMKSATHSDRRRRAGHPAVARAACWPTKAFDVDAVAEAAKPVWMPWPRRLSSWCCSISGCPASTGWKRWSRIQQIPAADRPLVVMISGHGTIETAVKATKLGAYDFLEKPLSIDRVLLVVKNALDHRRLRLENEQLAGIGGGTAAHCGRQRAHEGSAPATGADGRHQRPRADLRRERHGQGTGGARAARHEPAGGQAVRGSELRGDSRRPDRERTVRPYEGQLHALRTNARSANSRRPMAARCSSMKWAT